MTFPIALISQIKEPRYLKSFQLDFPVHRSRPSLPTARSEIWNVKCFVAAGTEGETGEKSEHF